MGGSCQYFDVLESLQGLFVSYPVRAEMSTVTLAVDSGEPSVLVRLREEDRVVLVAGSSSGGGLWSGGGPGCGVRRTEQVDDDVLHRWLGDEIANNWPFAPQQLIDSGELS